MTNIYIYHYPHGFLPAHVQALKDGIMCAITISSWADNNMLIVLEDEGICDEPWPHWRGEKETQQMRRCWRRISEKQIFQHPQFAYLRNDYHTCTKRPTDIDCWWHLNHAHPGREEQSQTSITDLRSIGMAYATRWPASKPIGCYCLLKMKAKILGYSRGTKSAVGGGMRLTDISQTYATAYALAGEAPMKY